MAEPKKTPQGATSSDWTQGLWNPIRSYLTAEPKSADLKATDRYRPGPMESEQIDHLDKEKIAEYLQEKHRSSAR
ncbi:hypothetical protein P175DRAFT_0532107 [Aspergillus ochraceoroseus IBT 24754]|uniref:Uncharacterized protein n=1 Tax=Aspergillus ochraceoroseus IBT 24754 TaxID=1392256 RepID=A0A2T5LWU3_9EURO|nr:uncharacterized protein P175DRAFT_0532107 [Aspergillus ochraceoroseus IBT 24754]PTU20751.1 hypothetical protein P175DRAFT_0532107 [Aspergillus ochraceoroseus IBT 24754]